MALVAATSLAADGTEVYDSACAICHKAMAPRLGDKAAWEPRLKQGTDALVASVVKEKRRHAPDGRQEWGDAGGYHDCDLK